MTVNTKILKSLASIFVSLILLMGGLPARADSNLLTTNPAPATNAQLLIPAFQDIDAKSYILIDANTGYILAQKNIDVMLPPASLTKLMTLYVAATALQHNQIHLTDQVRISAYAWHMGGSKMFIKEGDTVPLSDLIQGTIVASGNDSTVAIAEHIAGSEPTFVNMMNQTAANLGMTNTHFNDSNGLPSPNHYSSAGDLAKLARAWILNYPQYYPWFKQKWFIFNGIRQPNRNRLLWHDSSVDGMKTGHTDAAGFCLVASAVRDNMRLISVIMGAPSEKARIAESQELLNYGYRFYESHKVYLANTPIVNSKTRFGKNGVTPIGVAHDFYVTVPRGQYKNVKITISSSKTLRAPIIKGQKYGTIKAYLNNNVISEQPLIALQNNPAGNIFSRFFDQILSALHL
jgi:serine-type D-Ala-D-Ala carboxypeptidase (penicillin-binding protein 5/6)